MTDKRQKDKSWNVCNDYGELYSAIKHGAFLAVLMDIRDELKRINEVLHCTNCLDIPFKLDHITRNTSKPRQKRKR